MPLSSIKLPAEDVRLIEFEGTIFKIKLSYDCRNFGAFLPCSKTQLNQQVEEVLRAVLYLKQFDTLKICTEHFYVDCTLQNWSALRIIGFKRNDVRVQAHPLVIIIKFTPHGLHCGTSHYGAKECADVGAEASAPKCQKKSCVVGERRNSPLKPAARQPKGGCGQQESNQDPIPPTDRDGCGSSHYIGISAVETNEARLRQEVTKAAKKRYTTAPQFRRVKNPSLRNPAGSPADGILRQRPIADVDDAAAAANNDHGDHRMWKRRKSPRLAQMSQDGGGDGGVMHAPKRQSVKEMARPSDKARQKKSALRHSQPIHQGAQPKRWRVSPPSRTSVSPCSSHQMVTRQKSPPDVSRKRRRSSFSGMLETFLNRFW